MPIARIDAHDNGAAMTGRTEYVVSSITFARDHIAIAIATKHLARRGTTHRRVISAGRLKGSAGYGSTRRRAVAGHRRTRDVEHSERKGQCGRESELIEHDTTP